MQVRLLAAAFIAASMGLAGRATAAPLVSEVNCIAVPVSDMGRAVSFYTEVLAFTRVGEEERVGDTLEEQYGVFGLRQRIVHLSLGDERVDLVQSLAPRGRAIPDDSRANDRWFQHLAIVVADMDRAYEWLRAHDLHYASSAPQILPASNPDAGGIGAFYFRDTEDNFLELLHFPAGKGAAKWHAKGKSQLFLGIDHTAIVVADTDRSVRYYHDLLGLAVTGHSENYGTEQEHLNNVYGAHLRITALRAAAGPGIELLEYLTPRSGRAPPVNSQVTDRWFWQIELRTDTLAGLSGMLSAAHSTVVSTLPAQPDGRVRGLALVALDPDGHANRFYVVTDGDAGGH